MMKNAPRRAIVFVAVCVCPVLGGCGGSASSVSGEISYAGKPIENGSIRFFPTQGTEGAGAIAAITDGKYSVDADRGLIAGSYMVQVTAMQKTGRVIRPKEVMPGDDPSPQQEELQIIPAQYNTTSSLGVDLQPGENTYSQQLER
jgi:hypothetical protein